MPSKVPGAFLALSTVSLALSLSLGPASVSRAATTFSENFDHLSNTLTPRVDETHIPADLLGFSHTAPNGWTITNDQSMTGKGTTEWRGWSFTTRDFWAAAQSGQGRENFKLGEGVIAVADNDEWDDRNNPAEQVFNSALTSPSIAVVGGSTVHVNYSSNYRQTGPQVAGLDVSFDGGPRQRLFQYDTKTLGDQTYLENRSVTQPVQVPQGASKMTLTWAMEDATNDWYWAIDKVSVTDTPVPGAESPMPPPPPSIDDIPDGISKKKVLYVSLDGMRYDRMMEASTPNLDRLAARGQRTPMYLQDKSVGATSTGPTHANQFTGVWPDKHGIRDNSFAGYRREQYPDFLTRAEQVNPAYSTYSILDWQPLNEHLIGKPDVKIQQSTAGGTVESDKRTTATSVEALKTKNADLSFVYLHTADSVGHSKTGDVPEYITAIEKLDAQVGELVAAVEGRPTYQQEDWLIIVSTDHGMHRYGHGGNEFSVRESWALAAGAGIEPRGDKATRVWRPVDVAVSALTHVGITPDPAWNLDGVPMWQKSDDPFDTMKSSLQKTVDEPAKPRDLLGFTHKTPEGWSIEERTPNLGVTEYRGWTFTTDPFWTTSQGNQGREGFIRGRDVIAVADPDEWDDKGSPTVQGHRLDSTLVSPKARVNGAGEVQVDFQNHYRQVNRASDPQRAEVVARYDTGETRVLWSREQSQGDLAISQLTSLTDKAPAGATSVEFGWRMVGANNFYWAIDAPKIATEHTTVLADTKGADKGRGGAWEASALLTIKDEDQNPLAGALVTVEVPTGRGGDTAKRTCTTDQQGRCTISQVVHADTVDFRVLTVAHDSLPLGSTTMSDRISITRP